MLRSLLLWLFNGCALQSHHSRNSRRRFPKARISPNGPEHYELRLLFAGINDTAPQTAIYGPVAPTETAVYGPIQPGAQATSRAAPVLASHFRTSVATAAMMTMTATFVAEAEAQTARAEVGDLMWMSDVIPVTDPRGFATNGTTTLVVGNTGGVGFVYEINPSGDGATVGDAEKLLDAVAAGNSGNVASQSFALGVDVVDGRLIPFGAGADFDGLSKPTYWTAADSPTLATPTSNGGAILGISPSGLMVGVLSDRAATGFVETANPLVPLTLVGLAGSGGVTAVTGDSKLLVGFDLLWRAEDGSMTLIDTSSWEIPPEVLELPDLFFDAVVYGGNHYVAADCTTMDFDNVVCVWNAETGRLVAMTKVGDRLAFFQEVDGEDDEVGGQVALVVNGADGAAVYLNLDFATRTELSDRLGTKVIAANRTGLNAGGLGMVVQIDGSYRAVVFELLTEPEEQVIAVQTAVHQGLFPANVLSTNRRIFEVAIRGSADFDARTLDRNSLFIGDPRSEGSVRVLSIRFTDVNRDGMRDAIIKVDSRRGGILADTTSLRITGQTTAGEKFDGTREITITQKGLVAYWIEEHGRNWLRPFLQYLRREFRYWW